MDQNHKVKELTADVFGRNHGHQQAGRGYSIPMIAGTEHQNQLSACVPFDENELHLAQTVTYAFFFRHVLGGCMHCALWTRLDILPSTLILSQYQSRPGDLHFKALKHIVGYLRLHPDVPLAFVRSSIAQQISMINFELLDPDVTHRVNSIMLEIVPTTGEHVDPEGYGVNDILFDTIASTMYGHQPNTEPTVARISAPFTECHVDANLLGGLFERLATTGGSIEMGGTTVIAVAHKQECMAFSSTEAELDAATYLGKVLRWMVLFMSDLGLPFEGPIPISEDNAATRIIAHSGKITRNVRHVAIKTLALQALVRNKTAVFNAIGTAKNRAYHFTKALPFSAFFVHISLMLGFRFITHIHAQMTAQRNREEAAPPE